MAKKKYDHRDDPEVQELLGKMPPVKNIPLVGRADLREIDKVFESLPELEYPINSAGELIDKLGGPNKMLKMAGTETNPMRMIKYMPSYYFPIASVENFIEKMAELIRENRRRVDIPGELKAIKKQLPDLKYPIENPGEFLKMVGSRRRYKYKNREVDPEKMLKRIPRELFPIKSQEDFDTKVTHLMLNNPLVVKD